MSWIVRCNPGVGPVCGEGTHHCCCVSHHWLGGDNVLYRYPVSLHPSWCQSWYQAFIVRSVPDRLSRAHQRTTLNKRTCMALQVFIYLCDKPFCVPSVAWARASSQQTIISPSVPCTFYDTPDTSGSRGTHPQRTRGTDLCAQYTFMC